MKEKIKKLIQEKKKIIVVCMLLLIASIVMIPKLQGKTTEEDPNNNINYAKDPDLYIHVKIIGEVNKPGVYSVKENSIILDVIRAAGGITCNGTLEKINTANYVTEGMIINIQKKNEEQKISLNNAKDEDLELFFTTYLNKTQAQKLIKYRQTTGSIETVEEIKTVLALKESEYTKIKEYLTL